MEITKRVRISTGLKCNLNCAFCYYNEELNTQTYSKDEIKKMLDIAFRYNIRDIDFSGGEPTLRKDLPELISYAKEKGFRRICIITNGTRTSKSDYLKSLMEAGLNEILISLHGHKAEVHDELVEAKGSFNKMLSTLENCVQSGIRLRTNTVVNKKNYENLEDVARIIKDFKPIASNFICFNDWINAAPLTKQIAIRYSEAAEYIKKAIDVLSPVVSKVSARYIPFCFMEGYERHVCHISQNLFDNDEWIDSVKRLVTDRDAEKNMSYYEYLNRLWNESREDLKKHLTEKEYDCVLSRGEGPFSNLEPGLAVQAHIIENYAKRKEYHKSARCLQCSFNEICDGIHDTYYKNFSDGELEPVINKTACDPMEYRIEYSKQWK
ncbi:MAG: radical SAM protein [Ignavibacteria bacterium]|jgi:MoaA/NifB/PqqE/SkfB family radical SAM enzyme|nr:radical SAM protein [Ignavibacteria bacterium]MCU7502553.1 radical SAM protein [Ignavibacteria bacterium]MCU7515244.1 radical SAM protein [Ignavibacteria bacterium]